MPQKANQPTIELIDILHFVVNISTSIKKSFISTDVNKKVNRKAKYSLMLVNRKVTTVDKRTLDQLSTKYQPTIDQL
jgi:hypothetical protein